MSGCECNKQTPTAVRPWVSEGVCSYTDHFVIHTVGNGVPPLLLPTPLMSSGSTIKPCCWFTLRSWQTWFHNAWTERDKKLNLMTKKCIILINDPNFIYIYLQPYIGNNRSFNIWLYCHTDDKHPFYTASCKKVFHSKPFRWNTVKQIYT